MTEKTRMSCRNHYCACGCDGLIKVGDEYVIYAGYFFKAEHFDIEKADCMIFDYVCNKTLSEPKQTDLDLF